MTQVSQALMLQTWLSPSYPVGGYAYSHALENRVESGAVSDAASLESWVAGMLHFGAGRQDAMLIAECFRCFAPAHAQDRDEQLLDLAKLATALCTTAELRQESLQQGAAFLNVTCAAWPTPQLSAFAGSTGNATAFPVCFGVAAASHGVAVGIAVEAWLLALATNWISAAVRLNVTGQTGGQRIAAAIARDIPALASRAINSRFEELGTCVFANEIASLKHAIQPARLFRS